MKQGLLLLIFTCQFAVASELVKAEVLDEEAMLIDYFKSRCDTTFPITQWPIGFEHPTDKIACDTLRLLGHDVDVKKHYLIHSAHVRSKPDYATITTKVEGDFFGSVDRLFELLRMDGLQSMIERSAAGDPNSFSLLAGVANNPQLTLDEEKKRRMTEHFGPEIMIIFDAPGHLGDDELYKQVIWTAGNLHRLSPDLLRALAVKFSDEIFIDNPSWAEVYDRVLIMPFQVRAALLSIWSLLDLQGNTQFRDFLQAITWSGPHFADQTFLFNERPTWSFFGNDAPSYFAYMRQIEDLRWGISPTAPPTWMIQKLKIFRQDQLYYRYDRFFPTAAKYVDRFTYDRDANSLNLTSEQLDEWLDGEDEFLLHMAVAEISHFADGSNEYLTNSSVLKDSSVEELMIYVERAKATNARYNRFPLSQLAYQYLFEYATAKELGSNKIISKLLSDFNTKTKFLRACDQLNDPLDEGCFRRWISFPSNWFDLTTRELKGALRTCVADPNVGEQVTAKFLQNLSFPTSAVSGCTFEQLEELADNKINLPKDLLLIHGIPQASGGVRWAKSLSAITGGAGALPIHWLESASKEDFPINGASQLVSSFYNREGWSFLTRFSRKATHSLNYLDPNWEGIRKFPSHESYAAAQFAQGLYAEAFKSELLSISARGEFAKYKPSDLFSELFFVGKNLGIPRAYLTDFVETHEASSWPDLQTGDPTWDAIRPFYDGYLSGDGPDVVLSKTKSKNELDIAWAMGAAYALDSFDKHIVCADDEFRSATLDYERSVFKALYRSQSAGMFARFEMGNLDSICRVMRLIKSLNEGNGGSADSLSEKEVKNIAEAEYRKMLAESFNPFILSHQNFIDLRYIDSLVAFGALAGIAEREVGIIFSLLTLKAVYTELAKSFVNRDSLTLRTEQWRIENSLASLGVAIRRLSSRLDEKRWATIWEIHTALMLSAHNPLLSDRLRVRLTKIEGGSPEVTVNNERIIAEKKQELKETRAQLSSAKTVFEFIKAKSASSTAKELPFSPFLVANVFNQTDLRRPDGDGPVFLNLVSNGTAISSVAVDRFGKLKTMSSSLSIDLPTARLDIQTNAGLSPENVNALCAGMKEFHDYISVVVSEAHEIHLVPSVNLLPLPIEVLLGHACRGEPLPPTFLVNDFMASKELRDKVAIQKLPNRLVAVANPSIEGGFEIDLGTYRSMNLLRNGKLSVDLASLPPLPDAEIEVASIAANFDANDLLLGPDGDLKRGLQIADEAISKSGPLVLVLATHGFSADETNSEALPGLLSVKDGEPGVITSLDVYDYDLQGSTVILSACNTAAGFVSKPENMFTGFVKSLSDVGASLIVSSLWPVNSQASREMTEDFVTEWKRTGDLSQAVAAGKEMTKSELSWPFLFVYP